MSTKTVKESLRGFDHEQQRMMLAIGIILDRIDKLSREDCNDLFMLFTEYSQAKSEETREAADAGIMEILEQESVSVRRKKLAVGGENVPSSKLGKWLSWVSKKIHDLREKAGLSQVELAERTGLPQSHISRLENGKHSPSRFTLEKLAEAMDVSVSEFDPSVD